MKGRIKDRIVRKENKEIVIRFKKKKRKYVFLHQQSLRPNACISQTVNKDDITLVVNNRARNHLVNGYSGKYLTDIKEVDFKINVAKLRQVIVGRRQNNHCVQIDKKDGGKIIKSKHKTSLGSVLLADVMKPGELNKNPSLLAEQGHNSPGN